MSQQFVLLHDTGTRVKIALEEEQDKIDQHLLNSYIDPKTHPTEAWNNMCRNIQWSDIRWGFGFLASGFTLILIASWIDYINT